MSEETRICKVCGVEKPITCFYKQGGANAVSRHWRCSKCYNLQCLARRNSTPENVAKHRESLKACKERNPERVKQQNRESLNRYWKKSREEFGDYFVATKLEMRISEIPPSLMEAKRAQLKLNRLIYEYKENK